MHDDQALYDAVGGDAPFYALVDRFYEGVETDPPLRSVYPADLTAGKQHLAWFLIQRFGGPAVFNEQRGHPRLRMRHFAFKVDRTARDSWVRHMREALEQTPAFHAYRAMLTAYFEDSATFLING
jgi:hemoglobin